MKGVNIVKSTVKKAFAVILLTLMMLQILPASLGGALAGGIDMVVGTLEAPPEEHFSVQYVDFDGSEITLQYVLSGDASEPPQDPVRPASGDTGYSFSGWQSTPPGITPDNITADVVFTAEYIELRLEPEPAQITPLMGIGPSSVVIIGTTYYEVEFIDHDGTPLHSQLVDVNGSATAPEDPTREATPAETLANGDIAWEFAGWVSENPSGMSLNNITSDVKFRATYTMLNMTPFTVKYVLDAPDSSVHLPPADIRYFKVGELANLSIAGPMVPGYKPNPDPVVFSGVMGANPAAETVTVTYELQGDLHYNVRHWFEKDNAVANDKDPDPSVSGHFILDSSLNENSLTAPYGSLVALTDRAKSGYTMMTQVSTPLTDNNTTYNVYYKKNAYTLTYDSNGSGASVSPPVTIKAGNSIIIPNLNPTWEGYDFQGWFELADGNGGSKYTTADNMPAADLTIYGKWLGKTTVKYKLVHWVEKPDFSGTPTMGNMDEYIFYAETAMTNGTAGNSVPQTVIDSNKKTIITPTNNVTYATYQGYDNTTTLAGDGTTVINVYYNRIQFPFTFNPSASGTFQAQGLSTGQTLTLYFKFEESLIGKWPYPESGLEPVHTNSATTKLLQWNVPTSYSINRRDMLGVEFLYGTNWSYSTNITASYTTALTTRTYDLYYFERLPHQSTTNTVGNNISRTVSSTVVIPDGIPGYSRDILGTTGHGSMEFVGLSFITCDHSIAGGTTGTSGTPTDYTRAIKATLPSTQAIYEVYMKRNTYTVIFDKNTSGNVTAPPTMSAQKYGLLYANWPATTLSALVNWVPGVSPTYQDASGVTWIFENWHEFPEVNSVITLNSAASIPARNMTMYAHWKPQQVTVALRKDGSVIGTETLPAYSMLGAALPQANPTKPGHTFTGWYNEGVRYSENFQLKSDITLDAGFSPNPTSYTVQYLKENGDSIRPDYTVTGMHVDDIIRVPEDETPPPIAGFTLQSTYPPQNSSITLVEDDAKNIITFRYKVFDGYLYNIHYKLWSNPSIEVFPSTPSSLQTWAVQQVVWAKKDPSMVYYPVDAAGNPQEFQMVTLDPNKPTDITFYYRPYAVVNYTEKSILYDGPAPYVGTDQYAHTASGLIGDTVIHSDARTQIVVNGKIYKYDEALNGNVQSKTIKAASDTIVLVRYYKLYHTVNFAAGANGTLDTNAPHTQEVPDNSAWAAVSVPTPKPADGYYFAGWNPSLPVNVTEDKTYTATFVKKDDLIITANSSSLVYNGGAQSLTGGFTYNIIGATSGASLTLTGFTVTTVTGTDVDVYPNAFQNEANLVIRNAALEDITERYTPKFVTGNMTITKKPVTLAPPDASVPYTGLAQTSPHGNALTPIAGALVVGHTAEAPVTGGGTTTTGSPYTLSIPGGASSVIIRDGSNVNVTHNYDISIGTGKLTITGLTGGNRIKLMIEPSSVTETYTGSLITGSTSVPKKIEINSLPVPAGTTVTFTAAGSATNVGTHNVLVINTWKVMVNGDDMSLNYVLDPVKNGDLIIEQAQGTIPFSITPDPVSYPYNGQAQTANVTDGTIVIDGVSYANRAAVLAATGLDVTFVATDTKTLPGNYTTAVNPGSVKIMMGGTEVTSSYKRSYNSGVFKITNLPGTPDGPKIPLSIELDNASRTYNGYAQTVVGVKKEILVGGTEIGALNTANGNLLTVEFTASGTGTVPNAAGYPIEIADLNQVVVKLNGTVVTQNYTVSQIKGKLTINPITDESQKIPITIKPGNVDKDFNGAEQSSGVVTTGTITVKGQVLSAFNAANPGATPLSVGFSAEGKGTAPNTYDIKITAGSVTMTQDGVDVSGNYKLTESVGVFRINALTGTKRIKLEITPNDVWAYYTGELVKRTVTAGTILHGGVNISTLSLDIVVAFSAEGQGLEPRTDYPITIKTVTVKTTGGTDVSSNYDIVKNEGKLDIRSLDPNNLIPLHITPANAELTFNSAEQTAKVTTGVVKVGTPAANPATGVVVTFQATGVGTTPGTYNNITIDPANTTHGHVGDFYKVTANGQDVTANYKLTQTAGTLTIKAATGGNRQRIVIEAADVRLPYTGKTQTVTQTHADGTMTLQTPQGQALPWPQGLVVTYNASGSGLAPKADYPITIVTASVVVTMDGVPVNDSYALTIKNAKLAIWALTDEPGTIVPPGGEDKNKIVLTITPNQYQALYTGQTITIPANYGGTVLHGGLPLNQFPEITVSFNVSGSGIADGTHPTSVVESSVTIKANGVDVKSNYKLNLQPGKLIIDPRGANNKIPLSIRPKNVALDYDGSELTASVNSQGTVTIDGKAASQFPGLTVTFQAEGKATYVGSYDNIALLPGSVQVMAGTSDVTNNYDLAPLLGTLTIRTAGIPITIQPVDKTYTYNDQWQGENTFDATEETLVKMLPVGATITITKRVGGTNAGNYPIRYAQSDVTIMHNGVNITNNYRITCNDGNVEILKKKLIGTLTAEPPVEPGPFVYGDTITLREPPAVDAYIPGAGLEGDDVLSYAVDKIPNTNDAYDAGGTQIEYTFAPRLTPSEIDRNYDTTGLVMVPSNIIKLLRAQLTVTPVEVLHPQGDPIPAPSDFQVVGSGYKYRDRMSTVGPNGVQYTTVAQPNDPIGTEEDITYVAGPTTIQNYDVTYNQNLPGEGFKIYGWVGYHANYLDGRDFTVRDGMYLKPTDVVTPTSPGALGMSVESLRFVEWTLDAAGTMPYTPAAIGINSFELYAQWTQLYKLTVQHLDITEDTPVAPEQVFWLSEDMDFEIKALEIAGYEPSYIIYTVNGYEVRQTIMLDNPSPIKVPADAMDAKIYYKKLPAAAAAAAGPLPSPTPLPEFDWSLDITKVAYAIYGEDIPLAGIWTKNMGVCGE